MSEPSHPPKQETYSASFVVQSPTIYQNQSVINENVVRPSILSNPSRAANYSIIQNNTHSFQSPVRYQHVDSYVSPSILTSPVRSIGLPPPVTTHIQSATISVNNAAATNVTTKIPQSATILVPPSQTVTKYVTLTPPRITSPPVIINKVETNDEEINYLKFMLTQKDIEIKSWKKHAKHLERHAKGGERSITNIDTTQLQIQMQLLIEENRALLEKLESGKNEAVKHSGNNKHVEGLHIQIASLNRNLDERTNQNKILMAELDKLKALLLKKEEEIVSFSKKLIEKDSAISNLNIEISKHQGLKEEAKKFRQLFEDKNKDFFNLTIKFSEYEKIIIDAQSKIRTQEAERLRFEGIISEKEKEISIIRAKTIELEMALAEGQLGESERLRLKSELTSKISLVETLNKRLQDFEFQLKDYINQNSQLKEQIASYRLDIDSRIQIIQSFGEERKRWDDYKKDSENRISSLEEKISLISSELTRYKSMYEKKQAELQERMSLYQKIELQLSEKNTFSGNLESKNNHLQEELNRLSGLLESRNKELLESRSKISEYFSIMESQKQNIQNMEKAFDNRNQELDGLKGHLANLTGELDKWRSKSLFLEGRANELENEIKNIHDHNKEAVKRSGASSDQKSKEINELRNKVNELTGELSFRNARINELEETNKNISSEMERLKITLQSKNNEIDQLRVKYLELELNLQEATEAHKDGLEQIEKLKTVAMKSTEDNTSSQSKISELNGQITDLNNRLIEYENKIALFSSENARLQKLLSNKNKDLESLIAEFNLKLSIIQESEDQNRVLNGELDRLKFNLQSKTSELEQWKGKNSNLEIVFSEKDTIIEEQAGSIEKYKRQAAKYEDDISALHKKISDLNLKISEYQQKIEEYENKIALLSGENNRLNKLMTSKNKDLEDLRSEFSIKVSLIDELTGQNKTLSSDLDKIKQALLTKTGEFDALRTRYSDLEIQFVEIESDFGNRGNEIEMWKRQGQKLNDDIAGYLRKLEILTQANSDLNGQLNERDGKIASLNGDINRLNKSFASKSKELDEMRVSYTELQSNSQKGGDDLFRKSKEYDALNARFFEAQSKISAYEIQLANLTQNFEKLNGQFNMKVNELEELKAILIEREQLIDELNLRLSSLSEDLRNCTFNLETMTRDKESKIVEIGRLTTELEALRFEFNAKISFISELTFKYESQSKEYVLLKESYSKLEQEIIVLKARILELEEKLRVFDNRLIEYENKIAMLSSELARSKRMMENRQSNADESNRIIKELEEAKSSLSIRIEEYEVTLSKARETQFVYLENIFKLCAEVECLRQNKVAIESH